MEKARHVEIKKERKAVHVIQSHTKGWLAKRFIEKQYEAARTIQRYAHTLLQCSAMPTKRGFLRACIFGGGVSCLDETRD